MVGMALEFRGLRPWRGLSPSLRAEDSIPIQREEGREEGEKVRRRRGRAEWAEERRERRELRWSEEREREIKREGGWEGGREYVGMYLGRGQRANSGVLSQVLTTYFERQFLTGPELSK